MKSIRPFATGLALAAATLAVGCDDNTAEAPRSESTATTPGGNALDATNNVLNQAQTAGQDAMDQADATGQQMQAEGQSAVDRLKQSAAKSGQDMQSSAKGMMANLSLDQFKEGMSLTPQQTDAIIEKVKQLVGDGNMDQARAWVDKLDSLNLPQGYDEKVTSLKNMLN